MRAAIISALAGHLCKQIFACLVSHLMPRSEPRQPYLSLLLVRRLCMYPLCQCFHQEGYPEVAAPSRLLSIPQCTIRVFVVLGVCLACMTLQVGCQLTDEDGTDIVAELMVQEEQAATAAGSSATGTELHPKLPQRVRV